MPDIQKTVFISYRRTNLFTARAIYENLMRHHYNVFFDFESINAGDFEQTLLQSIESRAHFILILTPSALARCKNPSDWLRREIEHAITHQRNIIPLTFEGFVLDDIHAYLPAHLAEPLSRYNMIPVYSAYFDEAMTRLRERFLDVPVNTILHPPTQQAKAYEDVQQARAAAEPSVTEKQLSAEAIFEKGNMALTKGDFDGAIRHYDQAIDLKPDFSFAFNNRGIAHYNKGETAAAIRNYDEALRLNANDLTAYFNRGLAQYRKGNYRSASRDLETVLQHDTDADEARKVLSIVRQLMHQK
ncbi:MAG: tetratricopeptide repeat protein [Aggregatilineales bacterium]